MNAIDYTEKKAPFHLKFWGQIQNDGLAAELLGTESTDFWFLSEYERSNFELMLRSLAKEHSKIIVIDTHDGELAMKKTIATMMFVYKETKYAYRYDFGYGYTEDGAEYMFLRGNYSCDCNRSLFLKQEGHDIPELECGEHIGIESFKVILE